MNGVMVEWMRAEAERGDAEGEERAWTESERAERWPPGPAWEKLPAHSFPARAATMRAETALDRNPQLWLYRGRTGALLRRYEKYSLDVGRVPSLLGRDLFRSRVTSYSVATFEDRVIFVHDMEACLEKLDEASREVLARVILQEYRRDEAARLLHCTRMTVHRKLVDALDGLSEILLEAGLLEAVPGCTENSCQEGEMDDFLVSNGKEEK